MIEGCPFPSDGKRLTVPDGKGSLRVLVLGEAPGESENATGVPFFPGAPAGSVLDRAIRRCGFTREQFVLWNVVPVQPPNNWLEGAPWEHQAVAWGRPMLERVIHDYKPSVVLALGNVALRTASGMVGHLRGVSHLRGFVLPGILGIPCVGSFHPSFLRRGAMPLLSVLMHDIKLAVAVARGARCVFHCPVLSRDFTYDPALVTTDPNNPTTPPGYITHPTEAQAWDFLRELEGHPERLLAYDIETPRSAVTVEDESDELAETQILSIQFSMEAGTGVFMPWRDPFIEVARRVLAGKSAKVGANTWRFDDPLLEAHGCPLRGTRHDVRWMWHHLQPDLRAGLQFIASFYALEMGPWKHLHESHPELYGIADVDVIQRIMGEM